MFITRNIRTKRLVSSGLLLAFKVTNGTWMFLCTYGNEQIYFRVGSKNLFTLSLIIEESLRLEFNLKWRQELGVRLDGDSLILKIYGWGRLSRHTHTHTHTLIYIYIYIYAHKYKNIYEPKETGKKMYDGLIISKASGSIRVSQLISMVGTIL